MLHISALNGGGFTLGHASQPAPTSVVIWDVVDLVTTLSADGFNVGAGPIVWADVLCRLPGVLPSLRTFVIWRL